MSFCEKKNDLQCIANAIRKLSMEAVQKANSGHPGLPMGCAELGAYLYGYFLRYNPVDPQWLGRDRFILSAGHGSMLLYSCLHLSGYDLSIEDLKNFRQLHSKTPGHPEYRETPGVETTTGPLGQGLGHAVGQALALKLMGERLKTPDFPPFQPRVFCLVGDGCMMEGISHECGSFAGHLGLDNLVIIYDSNQICLDGPTSETFDEDVKKRFEAYGFDVKEMDGNNLEDIHHVFSQIEENTSHKPQLLIAKTTIGKGSPHKEGTSKAHGSPLGEAEVKETNAILGLSDVPFEIESRVYAYFQKHREKLKETYREWKEVFKKWQATHPAKSSLLEQAEKNILPDFFGNLLEKIPFDGSPSGRKASNIVIQEIAKHIPYLYGGSADLSCSDLTSIKAEAIVSKNNFLGRNIKFGVREFAMAAIACGMAETHLIRPFIGTFLAFSDYMRNAIRLACLMRLPVIYQFTHDSVFLGEDGPTHQPVEHVTSLRTIPHLIVFRPKDAFEVAAGWKYALENHDPFAFILSRQDLPLDSETHELSFKNAEKGAYILHEPQTNPQIILFASGSEVSLAIETAKELNGGGIATRVVSFPSWELFDRQTEEYKREVLGPLTAHKVSIEAGISLGWSKYIGEKGLSISIETFGASAPQKDLANLFGFTPHQIVEKITHYFRICPNFS